MVYQIGIKKRVIDVFEQALDISVETRVERFGLCLYDKDAMRLVSAVPATCFDRDSQGYRGKDFVRPDRLLMQKIANFNKGILGRVQFVEHGRTSIKDYELDRNDGTIVLYHTHPDEEQDFFSSIGADGDTDFSFMEHDLPIDIVLSANARSKNIRPPVCVTLNKAYTPFDPEQGYVGMSEKEIMDLDRSKGVEQYTHFMLALQERSRGEHLTIDFLVE